MSLIAELKRRNVFKVGAAYLALGWVVVQITATLAPAFHLPESALPLVTWIGVAAFPFVVVFSWVFELTPEGLKRESEVDRSQSITHVTSRRLDYIIIVLLVVAIGLFLLQYLRPPAASTVAGPPATVVAPAASAEIAAKPATAPTPVPTAASAVDEKSIAVLPFDNRSKLEDDAFFVDGVHDDILTQLSRIGALKVISRTSVERFRHTELSMKEIAAQLGVSRILEGAVQRAGERVRINVQLIDAASDEHLWAETYDRELNTANLFAIQSEVAQAIAGALSATLSAGEKARVAAVPTQSLEAWEAYQLGKQRMARRTSASLVEAKQYFDKAIALDPGFALAHVGLADVLTLQLLYGSIARTEALVAARAAANRALEIDPELGEAFTTLGAVMIAENQVTDAEAMYLRAIKQSPGYATVHQYYAELLWPQGRVREALAEIERAKALDPLSPIININLAVVYGAGGRFDDAERTLRKVIEIDPAFAIGYDVLSALKAYAFRSYSDAVPLQLRAIELDPDSPVRHGGLLQMYAELGDVPAVDHLLDELRSRWPSDEQTLLWTMYTELSRLNLAGAVPWAEKMIAVEPADTFALLVLSLADRAAGHPELALKRYMSADPQLREPLAGRISGTILFSILEMADLLRKTGQDAGAEEQLKRAEAYTKSVARIGGVGFGFADAQILALRGDKQGALRALREAADAGVRQSWQIVRDYGSGLDSIRGDPEFKSIFADIERDMAAQRVAIADGASKPGF